MHHFDTLLPELILDTVAHQGFTPTGQIYPLNSYENRVYEIALEDAAPPIVAKYYRPERWDITTISDEHRFLQALSDAEVPVVMPLSLHDHVAGSSTLARANEFFYAFYPKFRGRAHDELLNEDRRWLGRTLARLHNVGEMFKARHRITLDPHTYGDLSLEYILTQEFLPADLKRNIEASLQMAIDLTRPYFTPTLKQFAIHGDCHISNVLWNKDGPYLLDFDDMVIGPPIQDVWMLFHGSDEEKSDQKKNFFEGYEVFRRFDHSTLILAEPLRTLRMIRHAAWIGQRYAEPAFQRAFPYYREQRYWEEFLLHIKEQIGLLQDLTI
jgi:Ser/Thr protein kinase RdoA (MazF antagonist)